MTPSILVIILMGVSGAGKTTIGAALARQLGWAFVDADDLHPAANIALMRAGHPLTDADRAPWLVAVRASITEMRSHRRHMVMACSALKRSYREQLRAGDDDVAIVWLHGSPDLLHRRLLARPGHFMAAQMLASQMDTLEAPDPDEQIVSVDVDASPDEIVGRILHATRCPRPDAICGAR